MDAVERELVSEFAASREFTGKFCKFRPNSAAATFRSANPSTGYGGIPYATEQGISGSIQGIAGRAGEAEQGTRVPAETFDAALCCRGSGASRSGQLGRSLRTSGIRACLANNSRNTTHCRDLVTLKII